MVNPITICQRATPARRLLASVCIFFVSCSAALSQTPKPEEASPGAEHNRPPAVKLWLSRKAIYKPDQISEGQSLEVGSPAQPTHIRIKANASDPDGDFLSYSFSVDAGEIIGEGPEVTWDLTNVTDGGYQVSVKVTDVHGAEARASSRAHVCIHSDCDLFSCPTFTVEGATEFNKPVTFMAHVSGPDPDLQLTYEWSVSAGRITSGQATPIITVDKSGVNWGTEITATIKIGGIPPECQAEASGTVTLR